MLNDSGPYLSPKKCWAFLSIKTCGKLWAALQGLWFSGSVVPRVSVPPVCHLVGIWDLQGGLHCSSVLTSCDKLYRIISRTCLKGETWNSYTALWDYAPELPIFHDVPNTLEFSGAAFPRTAVTNLGFNFCVLLRFSHYCLRPVPSNGKTKRKNEAKKPVKIYPVLLELQLLWPQGSFCSLEG